MTDRSPAPSPDMPRDTGDSDNPRTLRYADRSDGWTLAMELLTATFVWGGVGWLVDRWLDTPPVFMATGFVLGNALGVYIIWIRSQDRFTRQHADLMAHRTRVSTLAPSEPMPPDVLTLDAATPDGATSADDGAEPDEVVAPLYGGDRSD